MLGWKRLRSWNFCVGWEVFVFFFYVVRFSQERFMSLVL